MKQDISKYKKFKNNNLPTPFYNKERDVLEFVSAYNKDIKSFKDVFISDRIEYSLSHLAYTGLYYPYISKVNVSTNGYKLGVGHAHAHNFEEVLLSLYKYPESFEIEKEDETYYSEQELRYIRQVKKYLLFLGLKDLKDGKESISRYRSKREEKYGDYPIHRLRGKLLRDLLDNKVDYIVVTYYGDSFKDKEFKPGEFRELITDEEDNYLLLVEVTKTVFDDINKYKKYINLSKVGSKCKHVVVSYVNIIERF